MPLTIDSISHIKNIGFVPIGVAEQFSINEKGERYTKIRVTHCCSFPGHSGLFVNTQVLKDTLQTCFYGFCLLRIIHMIVAMRIKWPSKGILIVKIDLNAAYQRVHANPQIAATCIAIVVKLSFLCLCLLFVTTSTPAEYTTISEAEINLGNDLLADTSWDVTNLQLLHRHLLHKKDYLPASGPLVKSDQLAMNIESKEASMDRFTNDIITITIYDPLWVERTNNAALLIIHTIFRPWHSGKTPKLDDPLSLRKLVVEVQLARHKTCLGWDTQNRYLRILLPIEKETAWLQDIR